MLALFLLFDLVIPYVAFNAAAPRLGLLDRRKKSLPTHLNELATAIALWTSAFYIGGYDATWRVVPSGLAKHSQSAGGNGGGSVPGTLMHVGILWGAMAAYARLSEFPALQTSLDRWRGWGWKMWAVFGGALVAVAVFAGLHVAHACKNDGLVAGLVSYLGTFLAVPALLATIAIAAAEFERRRLRRLHIEIDLDGVAGAGSSALVHLLSRTTGRPASAHELDSDIELGRDDGDDDDADLDHEVDTAGDHRALKDGRHRRLDKGKHRAVDASPQLQVHSPSSSAQVPSTYNTPMMNSDTFDARSDADAESELGAIMNRSRSGSDELDALPPAPMLRSPSALSMAAGGGGGGGGGGRAGGSSSKRGRQNAIGTSSPRPGANSGVGSSLRPQTLKLHLHHYQIFLYLALFTRFDTPWSRAAQGLALGAACHGVAAYGCDSIFEWVEDRG